jgi:hypothetical protein
VWSIYSGGPDGPKRWSRWWGSKSHIEPRSWWNGMKNRPVRSEDGTAGGGGMRSHRSACKLEIVFHCSACQCHGEPTLLILYCSSSAALCCTVCTLYCTVALYCTVLYFILYSVYGSPVLYCVVLYIALQAYIVLYCTLYCTQYSLVLCCIVLYIALQAYKVLYCSLYCTQYSLVLYCIVLYIALQTYIVQ